MRSPHFEDAYGATVSKDPISRITDKVLAEMAEWQNRALGQIDGGWCPTGIEPVTFRV